VKAAEGFSTPPRGGRLFPLQRFNPLTLQPIKLHQANPKPGELVALRQGRAYLQAGELPQINPSGKKPNRNQTEPNQKMGGVRGPKKLKPAKAG